MQTGHRIDHAETKSNSFGIAAAVAPIEAIGGPRFIGIRDTGTVIRDNDLDAIFRNRHDTQRYLTMPWRVLDRIVDQIANCLGEKFKVAGDRHPIRHRNGQRDLLVLRRGLVEFREFRGYARQIDLAEPGTANPRVDLRQPQQSIEDIDDPIDVGD